MAIVRSGATSAQGRRVLSLSNPATGEAIDSIEVATAADVQSALETARRAQAAWGARPPAERGAVLERAARILAGRHEQFADVIVRESGKPRLEALFMEVLPGCDVLQYWGKRAPRILAPEKKRMHLLGLQKKLRILYRPLGVVGIITPWNGPFVLAINPVAQALVAGNAVLLKPSEVSPKSSGQVLDLFREAGLPEGVLQVLYGDGETGAALVEAGCDKISFTGSVGTGRKVGESCGRNLIPCTLELGGKDAMIVCADADLERAANGAVFGCFLNAGQVCMSVERVYVAEAVAQAFIDKVVAKVKSLRQGSGGEFDVGPLFWEPQLSVVERHVEDARSKGARILTGGRRNQTLPGLFYEPTVLVDVSDEMAVMKEETFGPVLPIVVVRDEEEAIARANAGAYGLSASVWSKDRERAVCIAARLCAGSVCINDHGVTYGATEAPFGGLKASGVGQVNGVAGPRSFCHAQPILIDRIAPASEQVWYPYTPAKEKQIRATMRWVWGTSLGRWIS
ncbi:MAG TPA: aldehyde dehydrogenase family protein [Candidatus Limnocylindrales bacterium]|nr:aldehyde dehydrogenase family protein [Candidatus Limnocylindrales bacterium]